VLLLINNIVKWKQKKKQQRRATELKLTQL